MVATGARARELLSILTSAGFAPADRPAAPRLSTMRPEAVANTMMLYRLLGGRALEPPLAPGSWDLSFSDNLLVELDESFHFNRYRDLTLQSEWADALPWRDAYRDYSQQWERYAGTGGKRWSNDSAKRMFGGADPDGIFGEFGAPRWKQRALYDAMKDMSAASGDVRLARVSIYDRIDGFALDDILYRKARVPVESVAALVTSRIAGRQ